MGLCGNYPALLRCPSRLAAAAAAAAAAGLSPAVPSSRAGGGGEQDGAAKLPRPACEDWARALVAFVRELTRPQACQMFLFGIFSLTLVLVSQRPAVHAESSLSGKFQAPGAKEQNGVQEPHHEKVITVSTNGSIHSPKFPYTYPRNVILVWRLVAVEENMLIQLTFDERFGLEDPEDDICKYDFVEVEEPSDGTVLGRWCGSATVPGKQISKGNQIRIRFVSDEYFPSEPGFYIHYTLLTTLHMESASPTALPPSALPLELLNNAVAAFSTIEELIRYLEPERWQLDLEDLYKPTWHLLGKAYIHGRKSRVVDLNLLKEEVRMYSCTPRNFSVSVREELKRTDTIFWPLCLLVKRCGGNCGCCQHSCSECQCVPTKVTKKYHEVLQLKPRSGVRGLHKSLTDVPLDHHEECDCVCKGNTEG